MSSYALNVEIGSRLAGKDLLGAQHNGAPAEASFLRQHRASLYIIGDKSQLKVPPERTLWQRGGRPLLPGMRGDGITVRWGGSGWRLGTTSALAQDAQGSGESPCLGGVEGFGDVVIGRGRGPMGLDW